MFCDVDIPLESGAGNDLVCPERQPAKRHRIKLPVSFYFRVYYYDTYFASTFGSNCNLIGMLLMILVL